jgi:autotransporter-associated beta strand protein
VTTTNAADGLTISAVISGARSLTKAGAGSVVLSGSNTYTLGTTLTTGTITAGNNTALGTGTLTLNGGTLQGDGTARALANAITLSNNSTIAGSSALTFNGTLTNSNGNRTLTNNNAGGFTLGAVNLSNNGTSRTLTIAGTGLTTINGVIANGSTSTAGAITKTGTGTLVLNGTNTFAGAKTLTAGTVQVGNNAAFGTGTVTLNGAILQGDGTARTLANAVSLNAASTIGGSSALTFNGTFTNTNNLTLTNNNAGGFTLGAVALSNSATNRTLTIAGTGLTTINGVISNGSTSTAGALTKTGTGTLALNGNNTFAGAKTLTQGIVQVGHNNAFGTGTVTLNGATLQGDGTARTLANAVTHAAASTIGGSSALTFNGALTNNGDFTLTNNNSGGVTLSAVNLSNSATNRTLTIAGTGNTTIGGVIANGSTSTASALTKTGAGTLTLSGANTYAGATTVDGGTLRLGAANRISDSSALTVNASGTFDFNNFSETLNAITASGQVNFGTGNTITTAGAQNYTGIVNGGAVSLVSTGGGAITANNAANNFTGQLGVSTAGAVNLRDANALTLGAVSGSTITALAGGALTLNGIVSASATTGTPLVLSTGGAFVNSVGASALQTGVGGRWLVYSATPLGDTRGGLVHNFKQYNAAYGDTVLGTGNGFIYTVAPTVTASLTGVVNKTYNGTVAATLSGSNYSTSGAIDGDTVIINTPTSGAYDNANAGTGKNVAVNGVTISSANNGGVTVYGYQLANGSINGNVGVIDQAALTLSTTDVTKQFDGTTSALGTAILTAGTLYTNQSNGNILDSFNGGTFLFDSPTAGTGKTVSVSGVAVNDGNAGNNYIINYQNNTNSTIVALPAVPVQQTQTQVASIVSSSSGSNAPVLSQENAGISVIDNGFRLNSDFKFLENIDIEIGFLDTLDTGIVEITRESFANASPDDQKQKVCADGVSEC